MNRNNFAAAHGIQQIKRNQRAIRAVGNLDRALACFLNEACQVLRGLVMRLRCTHHADLAIEFLREERRAEVIVAHVRGEQDRTIGARQLLEKICALDLVVELSLIHAVIRAIADRLREMQQGAKGAEMVR